MTAPASPTPTDPVLAALARIEARLDGLEARLHPALDLVEQGPAAVGTAIDIADDVARRLGDVDERLQAALALVEKVSEPQTLRQLQEGLALLEQVPGLVATGLDIADATFEKARAAGVDVGRLVPAIESLTFFWGRTLTSPATSSLLQAAEAKEASALLLAATAALQKTLHTPTTPASLWSLVRAMNDPAIQRALGMLLTFAHAFGEGLSTSSSSRALPSSSSPSSSPSSPAH
jgi:hypothetical protein